VPNKAHVWVFEAIQTIRQRLPFPLLGFDSDDGSEVVNQELLSYCQKERLTFTRARPYRKNDNCYVEQKNYSVVRQTVGYQRLDTAAELMVLKQLYATLRLYTNFFQPTMKLKSKERLGSRVKKSYHAPQTPYQRVLAFFYSQASVLALRQTHSRNRTLRNNFLARPAQPLRSLGCALRGASIIVSGRGRFSYHTPLDTSCCAIRIAEMSTDFPKLLPEKLRAIGERTAHQ
jgi:hypothetical protein